MKYLLKNILIFLFTLFVFSCIQEEDNLSSLENQSLEFETFFERVSNMNLKTSNENIIYIDYELNSKDKTIKYLKSIEKEPDFFILESEKSVTRKMAKVDYQVSCDNGGSSWDEGCDGKWSCGKLIAKCLDQGGCATICQGRMAYIPQIKTFYLNQ